MTKTPAACPKCQGAFEEGLTVNIPLWGVNVGLGTNRQIAWIAGKMEKNFVGNIKLSGKVWKPIKAFRCRECGYLENYA